MVSIGNFSGCDVISLTFARKLQLVNMAEYQIKVEYRGNQNAAKQKWISFVVSASSVNSGHFSFASLVEDITRRCLSLNYLNEHSICLHYLDDENNWINLNHGDDRGSIEFWLSARTVPEREVKQINLKAGVLGSPIQSRPLNSPTNSSSTISAQPLPPAAHGKSFFANSPPLRKTGQLCKNSNPVDRMLAKKF